MTGTLILIAGPSGAGKDTLIRLAREQLRDDPRFVFVRRVITRPGDAGAEDHEASSAADFARGVANGAFALSWEAHGLRYGVPRAIEHDLAAGRLVIVNVSRGVVPEATHRYPSSRVVIVTAPLEMLAARLAARGREPVSEHQERLARPDLAASSQMRPLYISNDRTPEEGARALVAILRQNAQPSPTAIPAIPAQPGNTTSNVGKTA
jgi:ribose 1,5-bisphosphokinase